MAGVERLEGILGDDLRLAAESLERIAAEGGDVFSIEVDRAAGWFDQAHQHAAGGRFAAAALAHHGQNLGLVEGEGDRIDGVNGGMAPVHPVAHGAAHREEAAQILDGEHRLRTAHGAATGWSR